MSDNRPTRDTLSRKEATISNMWEIAAIVELPEQNSLTSYMENGMRNALLIAILLVSSRGYGHDTSKLRMEFDNAEGAILERRVRGDGQLAGVNVAGGRMEFFRFSMS